MRSQLLRLGLYVGFLVFSSWSMAAIDVHEFDNEVDRKRYQSFIDEMRCPKCQNQNLSGSDSPIAMDLRRELYLMIEDGKSDKEIVDFMVERYGEFILYRPRVTSSTLLLWGAPIFLLIAGIILLLLIVRKRRSIDLTASGSSLSPEERERLAGLLGSRRNKDSVAKQENKQ
ncbi:MULTISPECIES: cytochrome c-type biogenesis protein [unclassified Cellvibrio]|uniref:cytochrome c-type biogenesis protein n=1 Tax=unclassified Cellvibrio TaxID=2624793 RepID=UPI0002D9AA89|nr:MULTISPECIES: cytochrome c-type biogenesis protein [unclassified Cellvibrio]QEY14411.1 cytochrome c-type biogenesis protein CcmH [Cellvibrio sp. KY-YJ-3]UUA73511.1 cytochrome c-type biogenesis protein CcmH [Cellvibrio sp. QJXJ]